MGDFKLPAIYGDRVERMKKNIIFACDTPIQVLNAVNLKETYYKEYEGDIYIYAQFKNAKNLFSGLAKSKVFNNVFLVEPYRKYSAMVRKIVTIKRMLLPYNTLKQYCVDKKIVKRKYDIIAFSFITSFTISVFGMAKADKFILLEDGIGTYVSDILNNYTSSIFKRIAAHMSYKEIFTPQKIAVYNPQMLKEKEVEVLKLENTFPENLGKKIEQIFGYKENTFYRDNKIVYLTQPLQENKGFSAEKAEEIIHVLKQQKEDIVVRIHPRDNAEYYKEFCSDSVNNLWELECIHQISDDSILIGGYSTTQFMPKILKNVEPYVIFLYKLLFDDLDEDYWKNIEVFIRKIKANYSKTNKIIVPETIEELEKIMDKLKKEEA